jgi:predicted enzyme related to lactoylglutathione lyase
MSMVSIVEIPVENFPRARDFYQATLQLSVEEVAMGETLMGLLPGEGDVSVALVKGEGYQPTALGSVVYFQAGADLQPVLDRVVRAGGTVLVPKTEISPEMGYFAQFTDTEGNRLGLHSLG